MPAPISNKFFSIERNKGTHVPSPIDIDHIVEMYKYIREELVPTIKRLVALENAETISEEEYQSLTACYNHLGGLTDLEHKLHVTLKEAYPEYIKIIKDLTVKHSKNRSILRKDKDNGSADKS